MATSPGPLGRRVPSDWAHVARYPLRALPPGEQPRGTPVVLGTNWYRDFDQPTLRNGRWWVGLDATRLGALRGGHAYSTKSVQPDVLGWWDFYNQHAEGACVGEGGSRTMSLLNRTRYNAWWLWDRAKERDEWADTNPGDGEGTSVRAAMDVLREAGHVRWKPEQAGMDHVARARLTPDPAAGISANRWAVSVDEVLAAIAMPLATQLGAVPFLNSWGRDYPHITWMPGETLARLLREDGEAAIITDR